MVSGERQLHDITYFFLFKWQFQHSHSMLCFIPLIQCMFRISFSSGLQATKHRFVEFTCHKSHEMAIATNNKWIES